MAKPKNAINATTSVIVVKMTPDEIAGSDLYLWMIIGITDPDKPAIVRVIVVATANNKARLKLSKK